MQVSIVDGPVVDGRAEGCPVATTLAVDSIIVLVVAKKRIKNLSSERKYMFM